MEKWVNKILGQETDLFRIVQYKKVIKLVAKNTGVALEVFNEYTKPEVLQMTLNSYGFGITVEEVTLKPASLSVAMDIVDESGDIFLHFNNKNWVCLWGNRGLLDLLSYTETDFLLDIDTYLAKLGYKLEV